MDKVLNITYSSSITKLCEMNSSFDSGILRICYTGQNRNGTNIPKQAIEHSIKTIYNCPIVCNYDRETDTLGGHDVEVVRNGDKVYLANLTQPVGVIPESAKVWFENYEEYDGTIHEYLYAEALLWKRQEAYQKIKNEGITAHSMEITVKDGSMNESGIYDINDFEFTAFTLIGVEPCFESSAIEVFSKSEFKKQMSEMMNELKNSFMKIESSDEDCDISKQQFLMKGGEGAMNEKIELAAKYGIEVENLDFSIDDYTIEELTEKFETITASNNDDDNTVQETVAESADDTSENVCNTENENPVQSDDNIVSDDAQDFALSSNLIEELCNALNTFKIEREWGVDCRYRYVDCDLDAGEVYCWDVNDWLLYGFTFECKGDAVSINTDSKKRKKYVIADFDNGEQENEQESPFVSVFNQMEQVINSLTEYKTETENAKLDVEKEKVFALFDDLDGIEAFEALKEMRREYSVETLEEKCYAIRGKVGTAAKFALANQTPKIMVDKSTGTHEDEPYGGIFAKYGITSDN